MINIYTIVVTHNGSEWIDRCLKSLLHSTLPSKIIVVDNHSSDDTCEKIRNGFPEIDFIGVASNIGFGKANNIGIKKAYDLGATHFFLLNQDAWIELDAIEKLVIQQENNPEYGVLSPLHLNGDGNHLDLNFSNYITASRCAGLYSDLCSSNIRNAIYKADCVNAAAWLLSRQCIRKVGGFNPSFFHYGEDDNYIHRVHYFGFKVGIYPLSQIFHDRENRSKSAFDAPLEKFKRKNLSKYSSPFRKYNIDRDIRRLKISAILQLLRGRTESYKLKWEQHKILKEIAPSVKENLARSIEGIPLCFLNN